MLKSLVAVVGCFLLLAFTSMAGAQQPAFPPPLVKIIVPFPPGASTDLFARKMAVQLAARLKTTVIVENRAGGSAMIGTAAVAKGPRDGSMILVTSPSLVTVAATARSMPYDFNTDLTPVSLVWAGPLVVAVSAKTDIKTPGDLVAAARAKPGAISYGTSGIGTHAHLASELFNEAAKIEMRHVPYKGSGQAVVDLNSGTIEMMMGSNSSFTPHVQSGHVRIIGVTSRQPSPLLPGLPTMASVAPGYAVDTFLAVLVAGGTPAAIVQRLNREFNEIAASKEIRDLAQGDGAVPVALSPDEVARRLRGDVAMYKNVASAKNITLE